MISVIFLLPESWLLFICSEKPFSTPIKSFKLTTALYITIYLNMEFNNDVLSFTMPGVYYQCNAIVWVTGRTQPYWAFKGQS